jgi:hypothetical protein
MLCRLRMTIPPSEELHMLCRLKMTKPTSEELHRERTPEEAASFVIMQKVSKRCSMNVVQGIQFQSVG